MKTLKTLSVEWCCTYRCEGKVELGNTTIGLLMGRDRNEKRQYINWVPCVEAIPEDDIVVQPVPIQKEGHIAIAYATKERCCYELLKWFSVTATETINENIDSIPF